VDVLESIDVGAELTPNQAEKAPDPSHGLASFVNCLVRG
jgi:hypothetical protein